MTDEGIRAAVAKLDTTIAAEEEAAWGELRPLGDSVVPFLLEAYPKTRKWQGRASLVFHAIKHARTSGAAFTLGVAALKDKSAVVRYRACSLLAYSLKKEALSHLEPLLGYADPRTVADARAAVDAIQNQNHHFFQDRDHSGRCFWVVREEDKPR